MDLSSNKPIKVKKVCTKCNKHAVIIDEYYYCGECNLKKERIPYELDHIKPQYRKI